MKPRRSITIFLLACLLLLLVYQVSHSNFTFYFFSTTSPLEVLPVSLQPSTSLLTSYELYSSCPAVKNIPIRYHLLTDDRLGLDFCPPWKLLSPKGGSWWYPNVTSPIDGSPLSPHMGHSNTCMRALFTQKYHEGVTREHFPLQYLPAECRLHPFQPEILLEALRDKTILFVGDSLMIQMFSSFECLLLNMEPMPFDFWNPFLQEEQVKRPKFPFVSPKHPRSPSATRSLRLSPSSVPKLPMVPEANINETTPKIHQWAHFSRYNITIQLQMITWVDSWSEGSPQWSLGMDSDIILFNAGAHYLVPSPRNRSDEDMGEEGFARHIDEFIRTLKSETQKRLQEGKSVPKFIWREYSPVHMNSTVDGEFIRGPQLFGCRPYGPEASKNNYRQRISREKFEKEGITILDINDPSSQLFKEHRGGNDCRHWNQPGVVDFWVQMFAHSLVQEYLEKNGCVNSK